MKSNCCQSEIKTYNQLTYCKNCLTIVKHKKNKLRIFFSILLSISLIGISLEVLAPECIIKPKLIKPNDVSLSDSTILAYMHEIGILFPEVVLAQIHLESAHFKSRVCRINHNLLGIKYIKQKEATGENLGHAVFPTYKACLRDYKRLQKYYLGNLAKKYAEDSSYQQRLVQMTLSR